MHHSGASVRVGVRAALLRARPRRKGIDQPLARGRRVDLGLVVAGRLGPGGGSVHVRLQPRPELRAPALHQLGRQEAAADDVPAAATARVVGRRWRRGRARARARACRGGPPFTVKVPQLVFAQAHVPGGAGAGPQVCCFSSLGWSCYRSLQEVKPARATRPRAAAGPGAASGRVKNSEIADEQILRCLFVVPVPSKLYLHEAARSRRWTTSVNISGRQERRTPSSLGERGPTGKDTAGGSTVGKTVMGLNAAHKGWCADERGGAVREK